MDAVLGLRRLRAELRHTHARSGPAHRPVRTRPRRGMTPSPNEKGARSSSHADTLSPRPAFDDFPQASFFEPTHSIALPPGPSFRGATATGAARYRQGRGRQSTSRHGLPGPGLPVTSPNRIPAVRTLSDRGPTGSTAIAADRLAPKDCRPRLAALPPRAAGRSCPPERCAFSTRPSA